VQCAKFVPFGLSPFPHRAMRGRQRRQGRRAGDEFNVI
jgi:hypothetical protein